MNISQQNVGSNSCPPQFPGTPVQWHMLTTATVIIGTANVLFGATNLVVFLRWPKKQPFVILYWSLSLCEFAFGAASIVPALARVFDPQHYAIWPYYLIYNAVVTFAPMCNVHLACVCVDRWLCVEFPHFYRNNVNVRALCVFLALVWTYFLVFNTTLLIILREYLYVPCTSATVFRYRAKWYDQYLAADIVILLITVAVTQSRMFFILTSSKLQIRRGDAAIQPGTANNASRSQAQERLMRVMGKSVLGGSVIVVTAAVCQVPAKTIQFLGTYQSAFLTPAVLLMYMEHLVPLIVYWNFYPEYSKIFVRLVHRRGARATTGETTAVDTVALAVASSRVDRVSASGAARSS